MSVSLTPSSFLLLRSSSHSQAHKAVVINFDTWTERFFAFLYFPSSVRSSFFQSMCCTVIAFIQGVPLQFITWMNSAVEFRIMHTCRSPSVVVERSDLSTPLFIPLQLFGFYTPQTSSWAVARTKYSGAISERVSQMRGGAKWIPSFPFKKKIFLWAKDCTWGHCSSAPPRPWLLIWLQGLTQSMYNFSILEISYSVCYFF